MLNSMYSFSIMCYWILFLLCVLPALIAEDRFQIDHEDRPLTFHRRLEEPYELHNSSLVRVNPRLHLMLNDSGIRSIHSSAFENCGETRILMMTDNLLTTLKGKMFRGLRNLKVANFFNNTISYVANGTFDGLPYLRQLELSYNRLNGLNAGVRNGLGDLRKLHLNHNPIILSENGFVGLSKLELLELTGADILTIPSGSFNGLDYLERLDLSSNKLTTVAEPSFQAMIRLDELDLSLNLISTISKATFEGLANLKDLWLNDNQIETLRTHDVFESIPNLNNLYLHKNPLKFLDVAVFKDMQSVSIDPGFVTGFTEGVRKNFANVTSTTYYCRQPYTEANIKSGYAETVRRDYVAVTLGPPEYTENEAYGYYVPYFCVIMDTTNSSHPHASP